MKDTAPAMDLHAVLRDERAAVQTALERALVLCWPASESGGPAEVIRYALGAEGKRLRPILCVGAFRAVAGGPAGPDVYDLAVALELIHCYSLVHDDLPCMDDDALRRGRPTAHRVFGSARATVAAAAMIPAAFRLLDRAARQLGLEGAARTAMARTLARAAGAGGMVGGQVLDLAAEGVRPRIDGLEAIHRRKTGALFAAAACLGGMAARADAETVAALGAYGASLGFAFQVADDLLDESGAVGVIGKDAGRDRALDKATFPALLGLDRARTRARQAAADAVAALPPAVAGNALLEALARFAVERDR